MLQIRQNSDEVIREADNLFRDLFPLCRSITGNGVRQSLSILRKITDFNISEVPSRTQCYDWVIPDEWNIIDAYIEDSSGKKIVDFEKNSLHVVNYSIPIDTTISFNDLAEHINTLPSLPDAIPYRTTYYKRAWGFCMTHNEYKNLDKNQHYHVVIDSSLKLGSLTYGEYLIRGESEKEILFLTYCCHPSMGNDNLSGLVLWILLLKLLKNQKLHYSYRFIVAPETIGHIAYLSQNEKAMKNAIGGFILSCVAGPDKISYHQTFKGNSIIDKAVLGVLDESKSDYTNYMFDINSGDEKHYSAPFFRIPIGTICKSKFFEYDFYHTSKDDLDFISSERLFETMLTYCRIIEKIEDFNASDFVSVDVVQTRNNDEHYYISLSPHCEPRLGARGLYPNLGGMIKQKLFKNHHYHDQKYKIDNTT